MRVALISENSQASKNKLIYETLLSVAKKYNHEVFNYGMSDENDASITYVGAGLLAAILLNSDAVDFVITGCGTGEGAMLACNSFPNVLCGLITEPIDAVLFAKINNGNAISIPYAKDFGWAGELKLESIFENLFKTEFGSGYPSERVIPEQANKKILDEVKKITQNNIIDIINNIDKDLLLSVIDTKYFKDTFFEYSKNEKINEVLKKYI